MPSPIRRALFAAPILLAVPASAQQPAIPYGPTHTASGAYRTGFERSDFEGCWVEFTERGSADFQRLRPGMDRRIRHGGRSYQVRWQIRRTPDSRLGRWRGYGHLGGSKCQVEVQRVFYVSAR